MGVVLAIGLVLAAAPALGEFPARFNTGGYPFGWAETLTWPFTP
jgi:hypothetical protein